MQTMYHSSGGREDMVRLVTTPNSYSRRTPVGCEQRQVDKILCKKGVSWCLTLDRVVALARYLSGMNY
jgi:hypothetical protein